jgi:hypothetical protein
MRSLRCNGFMSHSESHAACAFSYVLDICTPALPASVRFRSSMRLNGIIEVAVQFDEFVNLFLFKKGCVCRTCVEAGQQAQQAHCSLLLLPLQAVSC